MQFGWEYLFWFLHACFFVMFILLFFLLLYQRDSIAIACYFFVLDVSVNLKLHGTNQVNNCKVILLICCLSSERHRNFNLTRILFFWPIRFYGLCCKLLIIESQDSARQVMSNIYYCFISVQT